MRNPAARWRRATVTLLLAGCCLGQVAKKSNEDYATAERRRHAASEMGHWVRPRAEQTVRLVDSLGIRPADSVVDVGSGVGYLIPYLEAKVGPFGRVVEEDIFPDFVAQSPGDDSGRRVAERPHRPRNGTRSQVAARPVRRGDCVGHVPSFQLPCADAASYPRALKSSGRLIIIEYYRSRPNPSATDEDLQSHIRLDRDGVVAEVSAAGFHLTRSFDHLPYEYVLDFSRNVG